MAGRGNLSRHSCCQLIGRRSGLSRLAALATTAAHWLTRICQAEPDIAGSPSHAATPLTPCETATVLPQRRPAHSQWALQHGQPGGAAGAVHQQLCCLPGPALALQLCGRGWAVLRAAVGVHERAGLPVRWQAMRTPRPSRADHCDWRHTGLSRRLPPGAAWHLQLSTAHPASWPAGRRVGCAWPEPHTVTVCRQAQHCTACTPSPLQLQLQLQLQLLRSPPLAGRLVPADSLLTAGSWQLGCRASSGAGGACRRAAQARARRASAGWHRSAPCPARRSHGLRRAGSRRGRSRPRLAASPRTWAAWRHSLHAGLPLGGLEVPACRHGRWPASDTAVQPLVQPSTWDGSHAAKQQTA